MFAPGVAVGIHKPQSLQLSKRKEFMAALEKASVGQNIKPFTKSRGELVEA